jgi:hypothetical protein
MGSHGGASAEGQAEILAHFGIIEATMGCPVVSSLDVVPLGRTPEGIEVVMDRIAYESDGVMLVARIKRHTDFSGEVESGLLKMTAVGMGKFAGAQRYHGYAHGFGMEQVIINAARHVLTTGKLLGGLAILEDAYHNTARLEAITAQEMEQRERELLVVAKSWMGRIPVDLDILIVDEMGKEISGTGMDTKVINRSVHAHYNPFPDAPRIGRVFVRDLSERSSHNAVGIGMADMTTDRLLERIDWVSTRLNALTSTALANIRTPIHFPSDRECLETLMKTVGKMDPGEVTIGWIRNTLELSELALTENLRQEVAGRPEIEIADDLSGLQFDQEDNLVSPFEAVAVG